MLFDQKSLILAVLGIAGGEKTQQTERIGTTIQWIALKEDKNFTYIYAYEIILHGAASLGSGG